MAQRPGKRPVEKPSSAGGRQGGPTADVAAWADELDAALRAAGTPERAAREREYLKSTIDHYGVSVPEVRAIAKRFSSAHPALRHDELCPLVEELWEVPVHERRRLAVELLERFVDRLEANDLSLVERLARESATWALVDELAPSVAGPLLERHPELGSALDRWAADDDFWLRRAALLTLLIPLRRGGGDFERFTRYADALLDDQEFFVRKAIGWVLRDTAKRRPDLVYEWLLPRAGRAASLTIREAIKPLSEEQRAAVVAARR